MPRRAIAVILLLGAMLLATCGLAGDATAPPQIGDGWQTADPATVGLDAKKLRRAAALIRRGRYENVHSLLIAKGGKLVFEAYFSGYTYRWDGTEFRGERVDFDRDTRHNLASVTKSFTSALVGIAIDQGHVLGVEDKVFDYFPEYTHLQDDGKDRLALEHLLTMTSGLEWNEMELGYDNLENDLVQLFRVADPIEHVLAKPAIHEPGTIWYYNGGNTNLLGEVIRQATGLRMDAFAAEHLFAPLGITGYEWDHINADMIHASGNLQLRPRDMVKFGQMYLDGGMWNGHRIVSEAWVEASTKTHASTRWGGGYGYQWWLRTYDSEPQVVEALYAAGWGGQTIIVFPELDMVVATTGGNYVQEDPVDEIVSLYVLPAVQ